MRITLIIIFVLVLSDIIAQDKNCLEELREGKFAYEGRYGQDVEILRTEGQQVELTNKGKSKLILDVNWTSENTYVLTLKEIVNSKPCLEVGEWIKVTVVECKGKRHASKYVSERCGKGESVFVKIE